MICNARLNLLILHPFPTPSQLPQQTEAQWPIYTEVPRNKNIYLRGGGGGEWGERSRVEENEEKGQRVSARMSELWTARWWRRATNVLLGFSNPSPSPIFFTNLYLLALYIHLSVTKQNMSCAAPPTSTQS